MVVRGSSVNKRTHCAHYYSHRDVVAVKFKCCDTFYACIHCHEELAGHTPVVWGKDERETHAIFCGKCQKTLSIAEYACAIHLHCWHQADLHRRPADLPPTGPPSWSQASLGLVPAKAP